MFNHPKKAQQVIEYLLLFSAVVVAVIAFLVNQSLFRDSVHNIINKAIHSIDEEAEITLAYQWVDENCKCSRSCGAGVLDCDDPAICQREDGVIMPASVCIAAGLDPLNRPSEGKPCVGNNCCGNGSIDTSVGEECDIGNLGGASCSDYGYHPTTIGLSCNYLCRLDPSGCPRCLDGTLDAWEDCEPGYPPQLGGMTCAGVPAIPPWTEGVLDCNADCTFNDNGCTRCGDGIKQGGEQCDHNDTLGIPLDDDFGLVRQCSDIPHVPPYYGLMGALGVCQAACTIDLSGCLWCGDMVTTDPPEECEPGYSASCYGEPQCPGGGDPGGNLCNTGLVSCYAFPDPSMCRYNYIDCDYEGKHCLLPDGSWDSTDGWRDQWCPGANSGLMDDTYSTYVANLAACTGAKCQKYCLGILIPVGNLCACPGTGAGWVTEPDATCSCTPPYFCTGVGCP